MLLQFEVNTRFKTSKPIILKVLKMKTEKNIYILQRFFLIFGLFFVLICETCCLAFL